MAQLYVSGPETDIRIDIKKSVISIGSERDNDFVLPKSKNIDDHAFSIIKDNNGYILTRLTKGKGEILLRGKAVSKQRLQHLDLIEYEGFRFFFVEKPLQEGNADSKRYEELFHKLHDFSLKLLNESDAQSVIDLILDELIDLTKAEKGFLLTCRDEELYEITAARHCNAEALHKEHIHLSDTIVQNVISKREPLFIENIMGHELSNSRSIVDLRIFSVACFPLLVNQQLQGVIYLGSSTSGKSLDRSQMPIMNIFVAQAAMILAAALKLSSIEQECQSLSSLLEQSRSGMMIGNSPIMEDLFKKLLKIAPTDLSVLIHGETGSGKELLAREVHLQSQRSRKPFVPLNCGAIPEQLLESTLFGHKKGSFTGAISDQIGKFEAANGGTIFLDEIAEMPQTLQVKLLRVLQEKTICRVGENVERPIDVRIISATHQKLNKMIQEKRFREDLFYRLNEITFSLPPLRNRTEDIPLLAKHFLKTYSKDKELKFSDSSLKKLQSYSWPGNIRELSSVVKKTTALAETAIISPEELELNLLNNENVDYQLSNSLEDAWKVFAKEKIENTIRQTKGNKTQAARLLGITPRTLFRYLESSSPARSASGI